MRRLWLPVALAGLTAAVHPALGKKKKPEEITQTLELPKDPPTVITAETSRLVFHVSTLSVKGLLSAQVRDALKELIKNAHGASIVHLRAFVAGSGDLRRVPAIVSETFTEKKLALPSVSVVQVGALPLEGAQVVIESTAVAKKEVNPQGLAFISGQGGGPPGKAMANLKTAARAAGSDVGDVERVTCFLSSLNDYAEVKRGLEADYRMAALDIVQLQRAPLGQVVECEAVARAERRASGNVELINPPGLAKSPNFSQIALVAAPRIVISGTQLSYGYQDSDARLAFQRLVKELDQGGTSIKDVVFTHIYPLSASLLEQVRRVRFEFLDKSRPPAATMLAFEGLPAMEAGFAIDVIALANK